MSLILVWQGSAQSAWLNAAYSRRTCPSRGKVRHAARSASFGVAEGITRESVSSGWRKPVAADVALSFGLRMVLSQATDVAVGPGAERSLALQFKTTILATLMSIAASTAALATTTAYDGTYEVDGTTEQGDCVRSVKGQLTIEGGHVGSISDADTAVNGLIDDGGTVSFVFKRGQEIVHAAGYMKGRNGSGSWSSNTSYCGGRWRAKRTN